MSGTRGEIAKLKARIYILEERSNKSNFSGWLALSLENIKKDIEETMRQSKDKNMRVTPVIDTAMVVLTSALEREFLKLRQKG